MYGRGYTVSNKSCNGLGYSFSGPSKKGECTDSDGVMSLGEIKNLIKNKGIKSTYLKDSMMKQIAWDDQWIGYDDEETFHDKKAWADGHCFGGLAVWSIDLEGQYVPNVYSGGCFEIADITAGPMTMSAISPTTPLAMAATMAPLRILSALAAAAILALTIITTPLSRNFAVAQLPKHLTSSRAGGTPSNSSNWPPVPTSTRSPEH